jgi:hypothetical protein
MHVEPEKQVSPKGVPFYVVRGLTKCWDVQRIIPPANDGIDFDAKYEHQTCHVTKWSVHGFTVSIAGPWYDGVYWIQAPSDLIAGEALDMILEAKQKKENENA